MTALLFLAFAYFAVGQAAVTRNSAQTAADAAALAAAREYRDEAKTAFLAALNSGDLDALGRLLTDGGTDDAGPCGAAASYADANDAERLTCDRVYGPPGYTVSVRTKGTVGKSVIEGTESKHAEARATAVVSPRCAVGGTGGTGATDSTGDAGGTGDTGDDGGADDRHPVEFLCHGGDLTIDPTTPGFTLDLSTFYSVHLTK